MKKFKGQYRIESSRLKEWDYSSDGMYFVTICTKDKECYLGDVVSGEVCLSEIGIIANNYWQQIPNHFPFVELDQFIIMPNHIHSILVIDRDINFDNADVNGACAWVETRRGASLRRFGPLQKNSLSSVINHFKGGVTKEAKRLNINFSWQERFYDHVIHFEKELYDIRDYIGNNPLKWELDRNNPTSIFY